MQSRIRIFTAAIVAAGLFGTQIAGADALMQAWQLAGFKTPESVLYDKTHDRLIVSNMNGAPDAVDVNGYLSLVSRDGQFIKPDWATGFDAPKGMAISGGKLFVADITKLRIVDLETGKVLMTLPAEKAVFLNDVTAADNGDIYVTDMLANRIYRYADGKVELWLESPDLKTPNGIVANRNRLIVGSWGTGIRADFSTEQPGGLLSVDMATREITPFPKASGFANVDGIVAFPGNLYVTDYLKGTLFHVPNDQASEAVAQFKPGSADIGSDEDTIYVPMMNEGEVHALKLAPQS
jgi:sugar lactone lactonase YvrE